MRSTEIRDDILSESAFECISWLTSYSGLPPLNGEALSARTAFSLRPNATMRSSSGSGSWVRSHARTPSVTGGAAGYDLEVLQSKLPSLLEENRRLHRLTHEPPHLRQAL